MPSKVAMLFKYRICSKWFTRELLWSDHSHHLVPLVVEVLSSLLVLLRSFYASFALLPDRFIIADLSSLHSGFQMHCLRHDILSILSISYLSLVLVHI